MDEKHSERSADLARLERQLQNLQRQSGEESRELRDRLGRAETTSAVMEKLDSLTRKVDALEAGPGRRWNGLTEKAAWAVCAAVIAFLLGGIGL